jgi:hypothetical protein
VRAQEIKAKVPIEDLVRHYGGSVDAKGRGRCLFPARHAHGDAHPSLTVRNGLVTCRSQGCFGDKGVDIFGLVGVMESLTTFPEQKRRVLELAGLNGHAPRLIKEYNYLDEQGALLHQTLRYLPKGFRQRRPDGQGRLDLESQRHADRLVQPAAAAAGAIRRRAGGRERLRDRRRAGLAGRRLVSDHERDGRGTLDR